MRRTKGNKLSDQVKTHANSVVEQKSEFDGNIEQMISTGSTLLDLAISGGRVRGGGIPGGILVEIFGQKKTGKTILLCEIAGGTQRKGGQIMFKDPEARLNKQFAQIFDLDINDLDYDIPDKVPDVFLNIRNWEPNDPDVINGVFADSLAALSTDLEMDNTEGDKMGMRRAKEFSEELRKTCRIITKNNYLVVGSNQIRQSGATAPFAEKYKSPGGESLGFYASLRLKTTLIKKLKDEKKIQGQKVENIPGIVTEVMVYDSSVWKPYRKAEIYIIFDYGIDDIRANLHYIKKFGPKVKTTEIDKKTGKEYEKEYSGYVINDRRLAPGIEDAIRIIEEEGLERELKEQVIEVWENIESQFEIKRKKKVR